MGPDYNLGISRSGFLFEIIAWVGLAVASGVIGNVAYDSIKNAIINGRRRAFDKRQVQSKQESTQTTAEQYLPYLHEWDQTTAEQYMKYISPYLHEWDTLSDEELEQRVCAIYEYAKQRLKNVRLGKDESNGA